MSGAGKIVFGTLVVGSLVGLGVLFADRIESAVEARRAAEQPVEVQPPRVRTEPLARRVLESKVTFTGTLQAVQRVDVIPEIGGRIEDVKVAIGDHVERDQLLAVIEHHSLVLAASQAKANRSVAAAAIDRARLEVETAERELERVRELFGRGAASKAELERSQSAVDTARAALRSAQSQHRGAKAAAGLSADTLGDSRILSPLAGTVTKRQVHVGTQVGPGTVAFEIQDIDELELVGAVTARDFSRLKVGNEVELRVDARPDEVFRGTVKTMSPSLDPITRRATIEVAVSNPEHRLLPNQFADAVVVVERAEGVLAVPREAVVATPDGPDLFTVRDGHAVLAKAELGSSEGPWVPIYGGLGEGEPVVVVGQAELRDGQPVVTSDPEAEPAS